MKKSVDEQFRHMGRVVHGTGYVRTQKEYEPHPWHDAGNNFPVLCEKCGVGFLLSKKFDSSKYSHTRCPSCSALTKVDKEAFLLRTDPKKGKKMIVERKGLKVGQFVECGSYGKGEIIGITGKYDILVRLEQEEKYLSPEKVYP